MENTWLTFATALWLTAGVLAPGHAQDEGAQGLRSKVFAGYSFVTSDQEGSLNGGMFALDLRVAPSLALVLDASRHWGGRTHMDESNVMLGPGFFFRERAVQPFVQALVGVHTLRGSPHFGFELGGGADVSLGSRWSIRGEADYLWSHQGEPSIQGVCVIGVPDCFGSPFTENAARLSIGVVYALPRR
jgi:hypothetical protein